MSPAENPITIEIGRTDHSLSHVEGVRAQIDHLRIWGEDDSNARSLQKSKLEERLSYLQNGTRRN